MKFLPAAAVVACAALLMSCGRQAADNAEIEKQVRERLDAEHQAQQQRDLQEREAALDERERVLGEREKELTVVASPTPAQQQKLQQQQPPQPVAVQPQAAPAGADTGYQLFYNALAPYGSWVEMPGYGYVWQPSVTVQDVRWRPYTLGHWTFTDNGWTWISDEAFGWITYHYGRWMRTHTLGWVWAPGDQWAPAWVSWRYGNDFVGWAPLPPEARFDGAAGIQQWADQQYSLGAADYTFVPASDFGDDSMAGDAVPPDEEGPIYDASNNVTNIYYDSGASAIICYGPNYEFMRSKSRRPLAAQLRLKRDGVRAGGNNGTVVSGNTLDVAAPRILPSRVRVAPKFPRQHVVDARLVGPATSPSAPGAVTQPLFHPPATPNGLHTSGAEVPAQVNPGPVRQATPGAAGQAARIERRSPSQVNPAVAEGEAERRARDLQVIQQQQAAVAERQRQEALRATQQQQVEQQRAVEAARAARVAEEQSARAAREQEQLVRAQAAHQPVPSSVPSASQAVGQGRGQ